VGVVALDIMKGDVKDGHRVVFIWITLSQNICFW